MKYRSAQTWLAEGRAIPLESATSQAFDEYVHSLRWSGTTGLDWSRMPSFRQIDLAHSAVEQLLRWVRTTAVGRHSHLAVWYSKQEGGIVVELDKGIAALDELYFDAPGPRFCFGVEIDEDTLRPAFEDLLQYGPGDLVVAVG